MNFGYINGLAVISLLLVVAPHHTKSCPLDFSVLNGYSSALKAVCDDGANLTLCCLAAGSGVELSLANYLKESGLFLLQNATQARLCLRRLRAQMQMIGVHREVVDQCSFGSLNLLPNSSDRASVLHWQPELCQGIQSLQDFQRVAAAPLGPMEQSCRANLADSNECSMCSNDMRSVQEKLSAMNNGTMGVECFNFVRMYVVTFHDPLDPRDATETAFCLYALRHDPSSPARSLKYREIGISVAVLVSSVGIGFALWAWWRGRDQSGREFMLRNNRMLLNHSSSLVWYDWAVLKSATDGFSHNALLGEGGYGCIYKGTLKDGRIIAVKQFKNCTPEGDLDFLNEVEALSKFKHKNLVNLQGCCTASSKRHGHQRILVYDYMPNRSLADYLFVEKKPVLTWEQRRHIAIGIAQGLAYLHADAQPQIIHRDIKASNVLLDAQLNAHIADFGLAKFKACKEEDSVPPTTHIKGTLGYVAPEYALYGQLTEKSDVYSFGVCLLELLSGRPALAQESTMRESTASRDSNTVDSNYLITDWAWSLIVNKRPLEIVDARIHCGVDSCSQIKAVMTRFVMVGMLCAHVMVSMRPSMADALRMLEGHCAVPVDRVFERPALPLSYEAGDYVISVAGRYNAMEVDLTDR